MRTRRGIAAAVLAAAALACQGGGDAPPTLERLRSEGVVRVGYANEAPYAYRETGSGRVTGEAPEIARVVFERMGVPRIEGVLTEFGSLIPGLQAGRFDVIAAGMYVTPERCGQVAFSRPTYGVGEGFVVAEGNPLGLHGYEDVRDRPDATLGVVAGTMERSWAREVGIPDERVVSFPDPLAALAGVRSGRVSAYAGTALTVRDLLRKDPTELEEALPFRDPVIEGASVRGYGAFAFRRADSTLVAEFDRELARLVGSPEHLALVEPFGFTERELPGGTTAEELCGQT